ncbi:MAG: ECF transporter S component, partial [Ruthenibacterium sp.]
PLLDTGALFMMTSVLTPESAAAVYLSGLPVNVIHAFATVLTLRLVSRPMFEKLDRIQLKYGVIGENNSEI